MLVGFGFMMFMMVIPWWLIGLDKHGPKLTIRDYAKDCQWQEDWEFRNVIVGTGKESQFGCIGIFKVSSPSFQLDSIGSSWLFCLSVACGFVFDTCPVHSCYHNLLMPTWYDSAGPTSVAARCIRKVWLTQRWLFPTAQMMFLLNHVANKWWKFHPFSYSISGLQPIHANPSTWCKWRLEMEQPPMEQPPCWSFAQ